MKPYLHGKGSAQRFGGKPEDYQKIPGELLKAIAEDLAEEKIRRLMEMAIDAMRRRATHDH